LVGVFVGDVIGGGGGLPDDVFVGGGVFVGAFVGTFVGAFVSASVGTGVP
jgi:hypothetical protein